MIESPPASIYANHRRDSYIPVYLELKDTPSLASTDFSDLAPLEAAPVSV